jgi:hypothetical protein
MAYTTIKKPSDYFNTKLYTGDDVDGRAITGVGFQPDFSWVKARSSAFSHYVIDAIRYDSGASKYLKLDSSSSAADETPSGAGWISTLNSDGYVCKNGTSNTNNCNENGVTYVAWNWLASNTTASNTDGSITSTVSANTTSGFSIVSYTGNGTAGATIGHGLGSAPSMIIAKRRSGVENWAVYHSSIGASKYINLDTTAAEQSSTSRWNGTEPTSSVFSVNTHGSVNGSGDTYIAYCFAEKQGYSKFGSYVGNGNADGTFIYTGFKPAFFITKNITTGSSSWMMYDNKRDPDNQMAEYLYPNTSAAAGTSSSGFDFLSNGIKIRNTFGDANVNGNTFIYIAFAEEPLVGDNPATAR